VRENQTRMQVTAKDLGIAAIEVDSYLEAVGVLVAHRAGINPQALRAGGRSLQPLPDSPPAKKLK
jgi:hypothetical protein